MANDSQDLFLKLRKRLTASEEEVTQIIKLVEKYNLKITIRNFDDKGILLYDERGRSVRICHGEKKQTLVHLQDPQSVIAIVYTNGLLSGWIETDKLIKSSGKYLLDPELLHKMPERFLFIQECPHLEVYGGFTDGQNWECAACKERLVFNDN